MSTYSTLLHRSLFVIAVVAIFTLTANAQQPKFKEGDRVEVDTTHVDVLHGGNPAFQSWLESLLMCLLMTI